MNQYFMSIRGRRLFGGSFAVVYKERTFPLMTPSITIRDRESNTWLLTIYSVPAEKHFFGLSGYTKVKSLSGTVYYEGNLCKIMNEIDDLELKDWLDFSEYIVKNQSTLLRRVLCCRGGATTFSSSLFVRDVMERRNYTNGVDRLLLNKVLTEVRGMKNRDTVKFMVKDQVRSISEKFEGKDCNFDKDTVEWLTEEAGVRVSLVIREQAELMFTLFTTQVGRELLGLINTGGGELLDGLHK